MSSHLGVRPCVSCFPRRRDVKLTSLAVTREAAAKDTGRTHKCSRLSLRCHKLAGSPISGGDLIILVRADG